MMSSPTNYLLKSIRPAHHRFGYIGVPHDAATTLANPGARYGPQALREALQGVFNWRLQAGRLADIDRGIIDLSTVEVADFGDIALSYYDTGRTVEETYQAVRGVLEAGYFPLIAGGDHGISFPCIKALHDTRAGAIGVIQLDAHRDLLNFSDRQGRFSGSSGMRRSLELDRITGANFVQVGLRGYSSVEQYQAGQELGLRHISTAGFAAMGVRAAAEQSLAWAGEGTQAIYLTVDLDVLNPGEAPGTGWPEPGGLTVEQLLEFVRLVAPRIDAIDIAELNPTYDSLSRATAILSARILLDCITVRV